MFESRCRWGRDFVWSAQRSTEQGPDRSSCGLIGQTGAPLSRDIGGTANSCGRWGHRESHPCGWRAFWGPLLLKSWFTIFSCTVSTGPETRVDTSPLSQPSDATHVRGHLSQTHRLFHAVPRSHVPRDQPGPSTAGARAAELVREDAEAEDRALSPTRHDHIGKRGSNWGTRRQLSGDTTSQSIKAARAGQATTRPSHNIGPAASQHHGRCGARPHETRHAPPAFDTQPSCANGARIRMHQASKPTTELQHRSQALDKRCDKGGA